MVFTTLKVSKHGILSGPYFSVFGLNTEIFRVNLCIQFKYMKVQSTLISVFGNFSRTDWLKLNNLGLVLQSQTKYLEQSKEIKQN